MGKPYAVRAIPTECPQGRVAPNIALATSSLEKMNVVLIFCIFNFSATSACQSTSGICGSNEVSCNSLHNFITM